MRVGLVACSRRKQSRACTAEEMYSPSALFRKAAAYCAREYDRWYVLSAKYGLLAPTDLIEPYDDTARTMPKDERTMWGARVSDELRKLGEHVYFAHAGRAYIDTLLGVNVVNVLEGLKTGQRLRWYNQELACPLCGECVEGKVGGHVRDVHGDDALRQLVLRAKESGMSDVDIGARYRVSFNTLQQFITEAYGANVSVLKRPKRVKRWAPPNFHEERTTVWSFRRRGDWATHDGRYRGNWSPYIPRNVILKYSNPGDVVLDYFVGGGTTAVEAKLLGRRCIARDINAGALGLARENLQFLPPRAQVGDDGPETHEPDVEVGDARDLQGIGNDSVDLICAHPPYAGIIKYSTGIPGDLSDLSLSEFLEDMSKVARESMRVLRPGRKCAILIGDARESKHVVPIGFQTIRVFLDAGFVLRELVIKRQHNCKTTGFWYARSVQYNFLLLAHEYLPIFEKPQVDTVREGVPPWAHALSTSAKLAKVPQVEQQELETTTVWILPADALEQGIRRNLLSRLAKPGTQLLEVAFASNALEQRVEASSGTSLVYVRPPDQLRDPEDIQAYRSSVKSIADQAGETLASDDFLVIGTSDVKRDHTLLATALLLYEDLSSNEHFALKEIIFVVPEGAGARSAAEGDGASTLDIVHSYLLVYRRRAV